MASLQDTETGSFSISMPSITCSFPCNIHPNAPQMIEVADAWLVDRCKPIIAAWPQSKLATKLYAADHLVSSALGLLTSLYFANATSTQRMLSVLKGMCWVFMLDNFVDEPGLWGADPVKCKQIVNRAMAVFVPADACNVAPSLGKPNHSQLSPADSHNLPDDGGSDFLIHELADIISRSAAEWWSELCADMPLSQQAHFCKVVRGYLSNCLEESPFRSTSELPAVQEYVRVRSHSLGWSPFSVLTEYSLCMELDSNAINHPMLKALKQSICESVMFVNDIASFCKEYQRGDYFNIIMVLCFQKLSKGRGSSAPQIPRTWPVELATAELLQESMNEACQMVKEVDKQCVCIIERIKGSRELMKITGMAAFLEAMGNYVAGNIYWSFTTGRYGICVSGDNYKPTPEQIEENMARALAPRTLLLKRPSITYSR